VMSWKSRCGGGAPSAVAAARPRLQRFNYTIYANEYTTFGGRMLPRLAHPCRKMVIVLEVSGHGWSTVGIIRAYFGSRGASTSFAAGKTTGCSVRADTALRTG
jgi:hypothetical protein